MRIALVVTTLLSLAPAALADPPKPAPVAAHVENTEPTAIGQADDCARARKANKQCVLDMGGETVDGDVAANSGIDTTIATFSTHGSLIHLRRDFIAEIIKTSEDL